MSNKETQLQDWRIKSFFYLINNEPNGPASVDDLRDLLDEEVITLDTKIRPEESKDEKDWKPIREMDEELVQYLTADSEIITADLPQITPKKEEPLKIVQKEEEPPEKHNLPPITSIKAPPNKTVKLDPKTNCYIYEDDYGVIMEYDVEKKAWFPRVEDILEQQQSIYGADQAESTSQPENAETKNEGKRKSTEPLPKKSKKRRTEKKPLPEVGWVEPAVNTSVYVTGLPKDITQEEFVQYFQKCGILKLDPETEQPKAKLYRDAEGNLKGDGLITYFKEPSVQLAIDILDGTEIKPGYPIKVQPAEFKQKGDFDPKKRRKKPKKKLNLERKLGWGLTPSRLEGPRVVILKNVYSPDDFAKDPLFGPELKEDMKTECQKIGPVEKVRIFPNHPDGVVEIRFSLPQHAEQCVKIMNGRWFDKRKIHAEIWDGKTKYSVKLSQEEEEKRWEEFGKLLDQSDDKPIQDAE